jgi:hypothetical protein
MATSEVTDAVNNKFLTRQNSPTNASKSKLFSSVQDSTQNSNQVHYVSYNEFSSRLVT